MKKFSFIFIGVLILFGGMFVFVGNVSAAEDQIISTADKGYIKYSTSSSGQATVFYYPPGGGTGRMINSSKAVSDYNIAISNGQSPSLEAMLNEVVSQYGGELVVPGGPSNPTTPPQTQVERAAANEKSQKQPVEPCYDGWLGTIGIPNMSVDCFVANLANIMLRIASWFLWAGGLVFQYTLGYSLNMGAFLQKLDIVNTGWVVFRDLANICFIFILLYIALSTILQAKKFDTQKMLVNVILCALLINFSLFFAKVVIDTSNIMALSFYQKIIKANLTGNPETDWINTQDAGLSTTMVAALGIESVYKPGESPSATDTDVEADDIAQVAGETPTIRNIIIIGFAGSALIIVTAFVFFVATILFMIRTVVLIFLMILSPLAFAAAVLPQTKKYFSQWWGALVNQSFFAPLYMLMIWVVFATISTQGYMAIDGKTKMNFAEFLTGGSDSIGTLYTFIIIIAFMLGSLVVAKQMGAHGGDFARNWGGKATFGAAAWIGRKSGGWTADKIANTDTFKRMKNSNVPIVGGAIRGSYNLVDKAAKGTWDLRNAGGVGDMLKGSQVGSMGTVGGVGGYAKDKEDAKKRKIDLQKTVREQEKAGAIDAAIALKDTDPTKEKAIQDALKDLSPKEFGELEGSKLRNAAIIRNASAAQRKAAMDEKNEKVDTQTRQAIKTHTYAGVTSAAAEKERIDANAASTKAEKDAAEAAVKKAVKALSVDERASMSEKLMNDHLVYAHFDKDTRKAIKDNKEITQAARDEMVQQRKDDLAVGLNPATANPATVKAAVKNLTGEELFDALGNTGLASDDIVPLLDEDQLKDLEKTKMNPRARTIIGEKIRRTYSKKSPAYNYVKSGAPAVAGPRPRAEIKGGEGFEKWS